MVVIKYSRKAEGMFFAHSDIIRIWHRIFAISGVSILQKNQTNSDKRIYFSTPTRVNVESLAEYVAVGTEESADEVKRKIQNNLSSWMELVSVCETKRKFSIGTINNCAKYAISFDEYKTYKGKIKEFFDAEKILINIELHGEKKIINVKNRIYKIEFKDNELEIFAGVNDSSVRIDELAKSMMNYVGKKWETCSVVKTGLYVFANGEFKNIDQILLS